MNPDVILELLRAHEPFDAHVAGILLLSCTNGKTRYFSIEVNYYILSVMWIAASKNKELSTLKSKPRIELIQILINNG